jgi:Zn-dependent protease with chaperone function
VHPKLLIFCAITIGIVLWSVFPRAVKFPDPGVRLREDEQPELFRLIHSVAEAAAQAPPADVFLVGDVNAFVAERGGFMGFGRTRVMGVGLPLLQVLTTPQLRGVIAHEFGHFHGGDTRLGPLIYRTREAIGRTVLNFQKARSLLHKPFEWYGKLFLRVSFATSRQQEFAADALSVRIVGLEPVQTALRRVNEVAPLYDHYLLHEFLPVLSRNARAPLAEGFGLFLRSKAMQKVQVEVGEQAMQAKGNPYDSHPPLPERLAAAAAVGQPGSVRANGPIAASLLRDVTALEGELVAFMVGDPKVKKVPTGAWADVVGPGLARHWELFAREKGHVFPKLLVVDLAAQTDMLEHHALAVDKRIPTEDRRDAATWMLGALLAHALHKAGFAVETGPGDPIELVRGEARIEPFTCVEEVAERKLTTDKWRETCDRLGIGALDLAGGGVAGPA